VKPIVINAVPGAALVQLYWIKKVVSEVELDICVQEPREDVRFALVMSLPPSKSATLPFAKNQCPAGASEKLPTLAPDGAELRMVTFALMFQLE